MREFGPSKEHSGIYIECISGDRVCYKERVLSVCKTSWHLLVGQREVSLLNIYDLADICL